MWPLQPSRVNNGLLASSRLQREHSKPPLHYLRSAGPIQSIHIKKNADSAYIVFKNSFNRYKNTQGTHISLVLPAHQTITCTESIKICCSGLPSLCISLTNNPLAAGSTLAPDFVIILFPSPTRADTESCVFFRGLFFFFFFFDCYIYICPIDYLSVFQKPFLFFFSLNKWNLLGKYCPPTTIFSLKTVICL